MGGGGAAKLPTKHLRVLIYYLSTASWDGSQAKLPCHLPVLIFVLSVWFNFRLVTRYWYRYAVDRRQAPRDRGFAERLVQGEPAEQVQPLPCRLSFMPCSYAPVVKAHLLSVSAEGWARWRMPVESFPYLCKGVRGGQGPLTGAKGDLFHVKLIPVCGCYVLQCCALGLFFPPLTCQRARVASRVLGTCRLACPFLLASNRMGTPKPESLDALWPLGLLFACRRLDLLNS